MTKDEFLVVQGHITALQLTITALVQTLNPLAAAEMHILLFKSLNDEIDDDQEYGTSPLEANARNSAVKNTCDLLSVLARTK